MTAAMPDGARDDYTPEEQAEIARFKKALAKLKREYDENELSIWRVHNAAMQFIELHKAATPTRPNGGDDACYKNHTGIQIEEPEALTATAAPLPLPPDIWRRLAQIYAVAIERYEAADRAENEALRQENDELRTALGIPPDVDLSDETLANLPIFDPDDAPGAAPGAAS